MTTRQAACSRFAREVAIVGATAVIAVVISMVG